MLCCKINEVYKLLDILGAHTKSEVSALKILSYLKEFFFQNLKLYSLEHRKKNPKRNSNKNAHF